MITMRIAVGLAPGDDSFEFLPYQLSTLVYWTNVVVTGDEAFGCDVGEGA